MPPKKKTQPASQKPNRQNRSSKRKGGKDRLDPDEIEREYGFAYQFFKSDPELWKLLNQAINQGWGVSQFQAHLKDTKWYKKHSDVWRQTTALKYTDKGTYEERLGNMRSQIKNLAGQWGAQLTEKELRRYSERALLLGWSPDQVLDHIAKDVRPSKQGVYGGQLAGISDQLRRTALANGVRIGEDQLNRWMRQIVKGDADVSQFESYVRKIAAKTFGAYGKEIESGVDLADIAAPYVQSMADILELNPASINMFDKTIRKAMSFTNDKGEPQPMSLTDFEDALRADRRWQFTDGARDQMKGYAIALGKMWGTLS